MDEYINKSERLELRWIPCDERLPNNDDFVIITVLDERGDTPFRYSDFGWYLDRANCWIVDAEQRTDVIAWAPLPEPFWSVTEIGEAFDTAIEAMEKTQQVTGELNSDCISRQAAIDAVEKESQVDGAYGYMDTKSIVDLLNDLPSAQPETMYYPQVDGVTPSVIVQPEQRWIPCRERLPEEDQYNLVTMQHANGEIDVVIARLVKPYFTNVPWEWESDDAEWTWSFKNGFAWMPLPAPYQAEGKDVYEDSIGRKWNNHTVACLLAEQSAQPTLYGYKIEHLAFIARVMEKENVPPEKVIEIMTDIERVIEMILADAEGREDATF